jgi:hypothetical protein
MRELLKAVEKTNNYASKYGQKLNNKQLFLRLISPKIYKFSQVKKYGVNKLQNDEWQKKINLVKKLVEQHLSKMKGIEMVGITGSVAAERIKKEEDIDILIVTKEEEMWWWRLYLRFYIWWHKIPHRRFGEAERQNEFCFNLWLDRANLEIPKNKRDLKNATDLVMMKIILDKNGCYQNFLRKNKWVKKYVATGYKSLLKKKNNNQKTKSNLLKKMLNMAIFGGQYVYMQSRQRKKLKNIKRGQAFFHED